jgi:predicted nucleic acid-binding protein
METRALVLDANVLVYLLLDGEKSAEARRLHQLRPDWVVPSLLRHEFMNVCVTYHRAGGFSRETCLALLAEGVALVEGREVTAPPADVVATAIDLDLSAYDAAYVAAAASLGCVLVTEDRRVLARAPGLAMRLEDYLADDGQGVRW